MARIVKKDLSLETHLKKLRTSGLERGLMILGVLLPAMIFGFTVVIETVAPELAHELEDILYFVLLLSGPLGGLLLLVTLIVSWCRRGKYCRKHFGKSAVWDQLGILESGVRGENLTARTLQALPDDYVVFSNLRITYEGHSSEMDFVVVGPTGVYIVEAKSRNGIIRGDIADQKLFQQKIGRGGTAYGEEFYNPVKQVGTHVYRLANLLRANGMGTYVQAAVYFAKGRLAINRNDGSVAAPVFAHVQGGGNALYSFITFGNGTFLPAYQVAQIVDFLTALPC